ncbi:hypothetical protein CWO85_01160 [Candidatus Phytoplasma ziziphi]|uniref:Uncharacterized protein n=1 Tax=Ziziphus jujuba witches'-broom phytoplasma TaxID=135727 RepID=A0A660HMD9_ZIZJU|nr:hypothetical protein [Candidatus Phytoplasma ziziphi]AYJ01142.1 hypothetical protein CWO85_01160 [Candidatus Phytoplasma ziziphi]
MPNNENNNVNNNDNKDSFIETHEKIKNKKNKVSYIPCLTFLIIAVLLVWYGIHTLLNDKDIHRALLNKKDSIVNETVDKITIKLNLPQQDENQATNVENKNQEIKGQDGSQEAKVQYENQETNGNQETKGPVGDKGQDGKPGQILIQGPSLLKPYLIYQGKKEVFFFLKLVLFLKISNFVFFHENIFFKK